MGKKNDQLSASNKPILVLGWGADGCLDVDCVVQEFPYDPGLECVKIPNLDSRSALDEISSLVKENKSLQILYLGAHGKWNGLAPDDQSPDKIGYRELADRLASALRGRRKKLAIWIGACESAVAAELWQMVEGLPVKLLVSFSNRPTSDDVRRLLRVLISMSDIVRRDKKGTPKRILTIDREVAILKRCFSSISVHYGTPSLRKVDQLPQRGPESLASALDRPIRSDGLLGETLANLVENYDSENLATRELLKKKAEEHQNAMHRARKRITAKTIRTKRHKRKQ